MYELHIILVFAHTQALASYQQPQTGVVEAGRSPVLEAHLASFESPEPAKAKGASQESSGDAASAPVDVLETHDAGKQQKMQELNSHRPRPVQRLVFDEATAATIPGGDGFVQPWSQEREAQVAQAAEDLQVIRQRRGVPRQVGAPAGDQSPQEAPKPSFMEPQTLDELPAGLKPHFKRIERYRPSFHGRLTHLSCNTLAATTS